MVERTAGLQSAVSMLIQDILWDVRFALRQIRQRPLFSLIVVITLALGIGANTAIFSLVYAALLRPFPYPESDRLYRVHTHAVRSSASEDVSLPDLEDYRLSNTAFSEIGAWQERTLDVSGNGPAYSVQAAITTPGLFRVLRTTPLIGRTFLDSEDRPGGSFFKVVLGYAFWKNRLGGDPAVIGRNLRLSLGTFEVIGVMPQGFAFPNRTELWIPTQAFLATGNSDWYKGRGVRTYPALARLRDGLTPDQALADLQGMAARLHQRYPETNPEARMQLKSLRDAEAGDLREYLMLLMAAAALVLLIGCANVANLMLVAAARRLRESTIRAALGAGNWRLMRQFLTESAVLGAAGGLLGLVLAALMIALAPGLFGDRLPYWIHIDLNVSVLLFTCLISFGTSVLFGLAPALYPLHSDLNQTLKQGSRGTARGGWLRGSLIIGEVALSLALLIASGLLIRSLDKLRSVHPGFRAENVLTFRLSPYRPGKRDIVVPQYKELYTRLVERLTSLPGVRSAGVSNVVPFTTTTAARADVTIAAHGDVKADKHQRGPAALADISPGYFDTMGIPLLEGRTFNDADTRDRPWVLIISERTAKILFGDRPALGRRVRAEFPGTSDPWATVVGIVGNVKHRAHENDLGMELYYPFSQYPVTTALVAVRFEGDPDSIQRAVREVVRQISPDTAVSDTSLMTQRIEESLWRQSLWGALLTIFAVIALGLAMIGLYGVLSYLVRQTTSEIGIRVAMGASPAKIVSHVAKQGLVLVFAGLCAGMVLATVSSRFLKGLLFSVSVWDPVVYTAVPFLLICISLIACLQPAIRAALTDPVAALRQQ